MDPQVLAAAERRALSESIELQLVEGRVEALPFPTETFDRVVAVAVLCFVRNTDEAMSEIARVLKPGGRVVIGELGRWNSWAAFRRVKGWFGAATWKAVRFRSARELRSLVESSGLAVNETVGAIYYPHIGIAGLMLARFDRWCARRTTVGAAFIAVLASKHRTGADAPDKQRCRNRGNVNSEFQRDPTRKFKGAAAWAASARTPVERSAHAA
jgi:SAM-dependent methyltransferase